jgi:hypothetical protein
VRSAAIRRNRAALANSSADVCCSGLIRLLPGQTPVAR